MVKRQIKQRGRNSVYLYKQRSNQVMNIRGMVLLGVIILSVTFTTAPLAA